MSSQLTIIARLEALPDQVDFVKSEALKMLEPTRAETGCITYTLHQDHSNPAILIFFELWENKPLWLAHMESDHLKAMVAAIEGSLKQLTVHEMTELA